MKTKPFYILLGGQAASTLGSGMTSFAVMIWAYQIDERATTLALLGFFVTITYVIASPVAGVLVDRWNRRTVMFFADLAQGLVTAMLLAFYLAGDLQIWHLYLAQGLAGIFGAFQDPAFYAAVSLLVPKEQYTRANGMLGLGRSAARMLAPAFAGLVLSATGLQAVMLIDLFTMVLGLLAVLLVRVPPAPPSAEGRKAGDSFWRNLSFGARYIWQRPGLRGLLATFFMINLFAALTYYATLSPMILARSGKDELVLGAVRTAMGVGGIAGGLLISVWGGSKRMARSYLLGTLVSFLGGDTTMALSRGVVGWAAGGFWADFTIPFIVSPYFALWQEKVPPDVQGRVFSTRETVQILSMPVGYLAGGYLADSVFEPAMRGGMLADVFGPLVGTGAGSGIAVMFLLTAAGGVLTALFGLLSPAIRALDDASLGDASSNDASSSDGAKAPEVSPS